jgi:hypothetical protein
MSPVLPGTATPLNQPATIVAPAVSPVQANPVSVSSAGSGPIAPGQTTAAGVPYDPRMLTLQNWATTSMNACDLARWNADQTNFTADEWNGLYDLYFNDWQSGGGNTAGRTNFWNTWRVKYQILTNTSC